MDKSSMKRRMLKLVCVPLLVLTGVVALSGSADASVRDTPNARGICYYNGQQGMLVGAKPQASDYRTSWVFVRYRYEFPRTTTRPGTATFGRTGYSNWHAFLSNRANTGFLEYSERFGRWYEKRWSNMGIVVFGNPRGARIIQETFVMRNGYFDSKAEVVLSC